MEINSEDEYLVPAGQSEVEIKVKGSRFIATILRVKTREEAEDKYLHFRKEYYNATHNCFAYCIDQDLFRYSDDGEPSGTAGNPILKTLQGAKLSQALCVVTRYFGGTKLGTGGLIRAYSEAAKVALEKMKFKKLLRTGRLILNFNYEFENLVRRELVQLQGKIVNSDYSDRIKMELALPLSVLDTFERNLIEKTNAAVQIIRK